MISPTALSTFKVLSSPEIPILLFPLPAVILFDEPVTRISLLPSAAVTVLLDSEIVILLFPLPASTTLFEPLIFNLSLPSPAMIFELLLQFILIISFPS